MSAGKPRPKRAKSSRRFRAAGLLFLAVCACVVAFVITWPRGSTRSSAPATATNNPAPFTIAEDPKTNSPATGTNQPAPTAADLENRAVALMEEGKLDEALAYLNRAVKMNPDDETTHFNLAFAYAKANRKDEAIKQYEEALKLFPDYSEAHNNLGNLLMDEKKYDQAVVHFSQ